jgi:hypothetical protein
MSSPKAAAAKAAAAKLAATKSAATKTAAIKTAAMKAAASKGAPRAKPPLRAAAKPMPKPAVEDAEPADGGAASAEAIRLAAAIEWSLAEGQTDLLTPAALQALMAAACKSYAAQVEAGNPMAALAQRTTVTPTDVMVTASGLLRAANLAVFELGMWQSWTGR